MIFRHADYEIDDSRARQDFDTVYPWLSKTYWWQTGLTREKIERGARHSSLVIGAYLNDQQVAFARIVSDTIRFAWIADVYVSEPHRKKGLARAMIRFALDHPDLKDVAKWFLATKDAHGVYSALGFATLPDPQGYMELGRALTSPVSP
jgi:GNAT superfamily N-acetyltransferase